MLPLLPPALPASTSSPAHSLPSCHTVLDTCVQRPSASGLGDCTPVSHVPFLRCPLLSMRCWGCALGFGPGSSGSSPPADGVSSLVSDGGSLVCWKVSSFSLPPLCPPSPYLHGPLWGSPNACWGWVSWPTHRPEAEVHSMVRPHSWTQDLLAQASLQQRGVSCPQPCPVTRPQPGSPV